MFSRATTRQLLLKERRSTALPEYTLTTGASRQVRDLSRCNFRSPAQRLAASRRSRSRAVATAPPGDLGPVVGERKKRWGCGRGGGGAFPTSGCPRPPHPAPGPSATPRRPRGCRLRSGADLARPQPAPQGPPPTPRPRELPRRPAPERRPAGTVPGRVPAAGRRPP